MLYILVVRVYHDIIRGNDKEREASDDECVITHPRTTAG